MIARYYISLLLVFFSAAGSAQTWKELNDSIQFYVDNGAYTKAIPFSEKAIVAAKKEFGEAHQNYSESLDNLAYLYTNIGEYKKAEPLFSSSCEVLKNLYGENDSLYAACLDNLGQTYDNLGQLQKAEQLLLRAVSIRKKVLGENHLSYAISLNNLGHTYYMMNRFDKTEDLYTRSAAIVKAALGTDNIDYAVVLNNLATLYQDIGQYEKAEEYFHQSRKIILLLLGEKHPYYAGSLNNLGLLYELMGRYDKAELLYLQTIALRKEVLGEDHPDYASALNNLGIIYENTGQYEKAERFFLETKEIRKKVLGENHPDYGDVLNNLAFLYDAMKRWADAERVYTEARDILKKGLGENNTRYASIVNNLGILYDKMHQYDKAEIYYREALEIRKKVLGENHPGFASSLNSLAFIYRNKGEFEKADSFYKRAGEIYKNVSGENHPSYATILTNLSVLYSMMGRYPEAEKVLNQVRKIETNNLLSVFYTLSEKEKIRYLSAKFSLQASTNSLLLRYPRASPSFHSDNFQLQLFLKSLALSSTKNLREELRNNPDTAVQEKFGAWKANKSILSKQYALPLANRRSDLKELEEKTENLEKELTRLSANFRKQQAALQLGVQDVQQQLLSDEAAVEFVKFQLITNRETDSIYYAAYVLRKNDPAPLFVPLFEEGQLRSLLANSGKTATSKAKLIYQQPGAQSNGNRLGKDLYRLIWQPLEPYLKNSKTISYSPAGHLYSIAMHALITQEGGLLMDKYQLRQYSSTREVAFRQQELQKSRPADIVLFGNPVFSLDSIQLSQKRTETEGAYASRSLYTPVTRGGFDNSWPAIPGTAEELGSISRLFGQKNVRTRSFLEINASEENLKALNGRSPQVLHIATHGFFLPEPVKENKEQRFTTGNTYSMATDPLLRNGLVLSGANYAWSGKPPIDGVEDGIVTAYEISQLNLANTELVVLSACETGLGEVEGNEGVFGLQRAFKMAGVKKMIVSLWKVPDKETAELMTAFYTHWLGGKTIEDSFTQAQAEMRKKYPPYYWAAFVLVE